MSEQINPQSLESVIVDADAKVQSATARAVEERIQVKQKINRVQVAREIIASRQTALLRAATVAASRRQRRDDDASLLALLSTARSSGAIDDAIKYHLESLTLPREGSVVNETLRALPGRYSFAQLQRFRDVQRLNKTVVLPVGSLASLGRVEQEKMASYLRLIVNRIHAMSSLPLDDVDEIAGSLLLLPSVISSFSQHDDTYSAVLSGSFESVSAAITEDPALRAAMINYVRNELVGLESRARERFISQTILQPLYRDVFVNREEFKWFDGSTIFEMAKTYARWMRTFRSGAMHSPLREDISYTLVAHKAVGGLASLQNATLLGVTQSAAFAIAGIAQGILGDTVGYTASSFSDHGLEDGESGDGEPSGPVSSASVTTPFAKLLRSVQISDIYGDPVGISEEYSSQGLVGSDQKSLAAVIAALADLLGIQIVDQIDLAFISNYPSWSGLISDVTSPAISADLGSLGSGFATRLEYDFLAAVLNGEMSDSTLTQLFSEANKADLSKVADDGLRFYSLAHKIVVQSLRDLIDAARQSYEWHDSAVWESLVKLNMISGAVVGGTQPPLQLDRAVTVAAPALTHTNGNVTAFRYAAADDCLVRSPRAHQIFDSLKALGVVGTIRLDVSFQRPFSRSGRPLVDVLSLPLREDLRPGIITDAIQAAKRYSHFDLENISLESNRLVRADYVGFGAAASDSYDGTEIPEDRRTYLLADMTPYVELRFNGAALIDQIPLNILVDESLDVKGAPNAEERSVLIREGHAELFQVDPTPFIYVGEKSVTLSPVHDRIVMPRDAAELRSSITRWDHDITGSN